MLDCVFSLLRQWTLRPHVGIERPAAALRDPISDHIPTFDTLESFQPRALAFIHGTLLTLILFYMTVIGIRYSWIHVLNLHFPFAAGPTQPLSSHSKTSSEHLQVDVIPTQAEAPQSNPIASSGARTPSAAVLLRREMIRLDLYVGEYISRYPQVKISIGIEGDHLALAFAGNHFALSPASQTKFSMVGVPNGYVDFAADAQGGICCLSWVVNGNVITAQRQ